MVRPKSSLFTNMPKNAAMHSPRCFNKVEIDGVLIPLVEAIEAGVQYWKDHLWAFSLIQILSTTLLRCVAIRFWSLKGEWARQRILEADLILIYGKPFIIKTWSPSIDRVKNQVLSILVWTHFSHITSILQPLIGIGWLAGQVGKMICYDAYTVARKRLVYAKALIEINPTKP